MASHRMIFTGHTPIAIQETERLPLPLDPAMQTWKLLALSLPVFRTLMPLEEGLPEYDTMIVGFAVKPDRDTVVQDTPVTVVVPY